MENTQFHVSVRLNLSGETHEIDSVRQAISFLNDWPQARRGPVFNCALNGCQAALGGSMRVDDARKAFESFARITGILVPASRVAVGLSIPASVAGASPAAH